MERVATAQAPEVFVASGAIRVDDEASVLSGQGFMDTALARPRGSGAPRHVRLVAALDDGAVPILLVSPGESHGEPEAEGRFVLSSIQVEVGNRMSDLWSLPTDERVFLHFGMAGRADGTGRSGIGFF